MYHRCSEQTGNLHHKHQCGRDISQNLCNLVMMWHLNDAQCASGWIQRNKQICVTRCCEPLHLCGFISILSIDGKPDTVLVLVWFGVFLFTKVRAQLLHSGNGFDVMGCVRPPLRATNGFCGRPEGHWFRLQTHNWRRNMFPPFSGIMEFQILSDDVPSVWELWCTRGILNCTTLCPGEAISSSWAPPFFWPARCIQKLILVASWGYWHCGCVGQVLQFPEAVV